MVIAGIVSIMSSCVLEAGGELHLSQWRALQFRLSEFELVYRVPGGQSPSSPPLPTKSQVDIEKDLMGVKQALPIFAHTWAYDGSLDLVVSVGKGPDDYDKNLMDLGNLQEAIRRGLEQTYEPINKRRLEAGASMLKPPESYNTVIIDGRDWLVYSLSGSVNSTNYVTGLTPSRYLLVSVGFIDNSRGYQSNWRQEMQKVADEILASLTLRIVN